MSRTLPSSADIIIVGGGSIGCSLAYHLTRLGLRPLLLERHELGGGSTGRCAGGVRQQFSTEVNVRIGMMSRRLLESFEDEVGATAALRQIGYLFLATTEADAARFVRNVEMQQRVGLHDVRLLTPTEAGDILPDLRVDDVVAATFCPSDGLAGPNEVTMGYANAARRAGAAIVENIEVTRITRARGHVTGVEAGDEKVASPLVVNSAGPYAGVVGKMAGVDVPVKPFRRHLFTTEPFRVAGEVPMMVDFRTSFYCHPEGEGLLLGMSDPHEPSSFDTSVAWDFLEHLVEHATWRVPALEHAAIATGWAGLYEVSPDHQGIVGESPELGGLWLCCGFSGHGFMQAPAIGALLADAIADRPPVIDLGPLAPTRFAAGQMTPEAAVI